MYRDSTSTDEECREAVVKAFGALWRDSAPPSPQVRLARELLRDVLTKQEAGIGARWAIETFGPMTEREAIALDMKAGVFPVNTAAS